MLPWPLRWWSPIVGPLAAGAAWGWGQTDRLPRAARVVALGALAAVTCGGLARSWRTAGESLAVATGCQHRHDFLLTREPTYRAASLVNRIIAPEQRLFCQDARAFYFACLTAHKSDVRSPGPLAPAADREADLIAWARADGFSYVLFAEPVGTASVEAARTDVEAADSGPRAGFARGRRPIGKIIPILEYRFADDNNRSIRYRLLRIR